MGFDFQNNNLGTISYNDMVLDGLLSLIQKFNREENKHNKFYAHIEGNTLIWKFDDILSRQSINNIMLFLIKHKKLFKICMNNIVTNLYCKIDELYIDIFCSDTSPTHGIIPEDFKFAFTFIIDTLPKNKRPLYLHKHSIVLSALTSNILPCLKVWESQDYFNLCSCLQWLYEYNKLNLPQWDSNNPNIMVSIIITAFIDKAIKEYYNMDNTNHMTSTISLSHLEGWMKLYEVCLINQNTRDNVI